MSGKAKGGGEEEGGGHEVGLWYVSFSDMITLLLSFFVMLATFSSYGKEELNKFAGVMGYMSTYSVFPGKGNPYDAMIKPPDRPIDWTDRGSESHTEGTDYVGDPRELPWVNSQDAWRDTKKFFVPNEDLYWAQGSHLSAEGLGRLQKIAGFLKMVPGMVIISEVRVVTTGEQASDRALDRAWAVAEYLHEKCGIAYDRVCISPTVSVEKVYGKDGLQIDLQTRRVLK